jgi:N utilization substance protein B
MQILYESDVTGHSTSEILARTRNQGGTPDETLAYASDLLSGIRARKQDIEEEIATSAPEFPVDDLPPIDRAILEIALFEALYGEDVPPRAAVNEAVGIAREFGGDNSVAFINGVLGDVIDRRFPEASRKRR